MANPRVQLPQADFWEAPEISFPPEVLAAKFGSCPNPSQSFRLIRFTSYLATVQNPLRRRSLRSSDSASVPIVMRL